MLPKYRYLYLMERVSNKSLYAKISCQHEIKIGIANDPQARLKQVNKAIKGEVLLSYYLKIPWAESREKKLHKIFSASRFRIKGGKGGGTTEWFYFNWLELTFVLLWLAWFKIAHWVYLTLIILSIIYLKPYI